MKKSFFSFFLLASIGLSVYAQECVTMERHAELLKKDPTLKLRLEEKEKQTQEWLKNNELSRIKYVKPPQESLKEKSVTPSTLSLCGYDNTLIATISAPTTTGQIVSPSPNCVNGGQSVKVTGLVAGNLYRISTCGTNNFDTQLTIYSPDWGGIAEAHNDDYCGTQSEIYFNPRTSGTFDILVDAFNCQSNTLCASLAVELVSTPHPVIQVPVVFHVIHSGEAIGTGKNISDAKLLAQLVTINQDFRRLNSGQTSLPAAFKGMTDDVLIEFCLATKDPSGNATTGITRSQGQSGAYSWSTFDANVKPNTIWDNHKYLNIWIANLGSSSGYSSFPGEPDNVDGCTFNYSWVGAGAHMPATHEVGHWLDLRHIWGDENACGGDDLVADTPLQAVNNANVCPTFPKTDACTPKYPGVMFYNYMDYSANACLSMFSVGQAARMNACIFGIRAGIQTSNGCGASGGTIDVTNYDLSNSVSVYPNPTNGTFLISTEEKQEKINLSIINVLGEKIFETSSSEKETTIDIKNQPNGIYFISVKSEQGAVIKKLIINK